MILLYLHGITWIKLFFSQNGDIVKFIIVAASPIEAAPQTLKKNLFFLQKFLNWKTSN